MTTEVFIGHMNKGYNKSVEVSFIDDDGKEYLGTTAVLKPGECRKFLIYTGQNIYLKEIENGGSES